MSPASYQTAPPRDEFWRAGNGTRTRDPNLGKVVLYQLSYSRAPPKSNPDGRVSTTLSAPYVRPTDRPTVRPMEARGIEPLTS